MELSKCKNDLDEDRISRLPDGSLIRILSRLTMKEAARTGVLSTRFKDLWTHSTGCFDFDGSGLLKKSIVRFKKVFKIADVEERTERMERLLELERKNYIDWVNRVLNSHTGATMDQLRVQFDLNSNYTSHIDSWVRYAFEKRVKRLELNFELPPKLMLEEHYSFPMQSLDFSRVASLTSIRFAYVDVTAECLECFQASCQYLEELSVDHSDSLVVLKVFGSSLKKLRIISCASLEGIEISAKNLATLQYFGSEVNLCFKSACRLSKISLGGSCPKLINHRSFSELSCYFSQLQTLVLRYHDPTMNFQKFPELRNLKKFILLVSAFSMDTFIPWIFLIEACPSLYSFTIMADIYTHRSNNSLPPDWRKWSKWEEPLPEKRLLECPKVVEFVGFTGHRVHVDLVMYLLENVASLEKMTIDTRRPSSIGTEEGDLEDETRLEAKKCALVLETKLPAGVELKII